MLIAVEGKANDSLGLVSVYRASFHDFRELTLIEMIVTVVVVGPRRVDSYN